MASKIHIARTGDKFPPLKYKAEVPPAAFEEGQKGGEPFVGRRKAARATKVRLPARARWPKLSTADLRGVVLDMFCVSL
jgi:hypothetical protein